MYRKCLIAVGIMVLCISTLYAHPNWGVTYNNSYEWAKKYARVGVYLEVRPWTRVRPLGVLQIIETTSGSGIYTDCIDLELRANFRNVTVQAVVSELVNLHAGNPDTNWQVSLVRSGNPPSYSTNSPASTTVTIPTLHNRQPAILRLCLRVTDPIWPNDWENPLAQVIITTYMTYVTNPTQVGDPVYLDVTGPGE